MTILCEGPHCNAGQSAHDRERAIVAEMPAMTGELRADADKHARLVTSKQLALTPHTFLARRGGSLMYACECCGYERVYGNTEGWLHGWGEER